MYSLQRPYVHLFAAIVLTGAASSSAQSVQVVGPQGRLVPAGGYVVYPASQPRPREVAERPPGNLLGTFYPEASVNIMGSGEVRGGYSPLDMYGPNTLSLIGPLSVYRVKTAPVDTYSRGYDGMMRRSQGVSLSYPNFPAASPVIYPTRGNVFNGLRRTGVPPWWTNASNWIDQN